MSAGTVLETPGFDSDALYEIIDGQRVEIAPMGTISNRLANRLKRELDSCTWPTYGDSYVETLFHLALPVDRNRRPDVAFVSFQRWPKDRPTPDQNAWDVVPNLTTEVVSPHDLIEELMEKLDEYFRSGVELVWVIHPHQKLVQVYESMTSLRVLTQNDVLDGGKVIPQFRLRLSDFFFP